MVLLLYNLVSHTFDHRDITLEFNEIPIEIKFISFSELFSKSLANFNHSFINKIRIIPH